MAARRVRRVTTDAQRPDAGSELASRRIGERMFRRQAVQRWAEHRDGRHLRAVHGTHEHGGGAEARHDAGRVPGSAWAWSRPPR